MTKNSFALRSVSAAAIVGLSLGLGAPVALAQGTSPVITQTTGNFTIHKFGDPDTPGNPTGTTADAPAPGTATPLKGVEFTVTAVELYKKLPDGSTQLIPAGTNEWLAAAQGLDAKTLDSMIKAGTAKLGTSQVVATGADGSVSMPGIAIGAYLVQETKPLTGWDDPSTEQKESINFTPAADFIAFVPMTKDNATTGGTSWNYDVHAYPKNYKRTPGEKKVTDTEKNVGEIVTYDINTEIRKIEDGKQLTYYYIKDVMDFAHLDVANAKITVTLDRKVAADGQVIEEGTVLTEGTHYKVVSKSDTTGEVLISFQDAGLDLLKTGTKVNTKIEVLNDVAGTVVPNQAREIFPNNPSDDVDTKTTTTPPDTPPTDNPGEPTNPVNTFYGDVEFKKVGENRAALANAEFKIIRTAAGTKTCEGVDTAAAGVNGEQGGKVTNVFKSDDNGNVVITGLHVTDFANNAVIADNERSVYCLVETKAPAGYELLAKPIKFDFTANPDTVKGDDPLTKDVDETVREYAKQKLTVGENIGEIVNLKDTTPQLPLTGGAGIGVLAGIGAALVGIGAWFARRNTKKA